MKSLSCFTLLLLALLAVSYSPSTVNAQESDESSIFEDTTYDEDELTVAPPELVKDFLAAVKASDFYEVATSVTPADVEKMMPEWKLSHPAGVRARTGSFIERLTDDNIPVKIGDDTWELSYNSTEVAPSVYKNYLALEMERKKPGAEKSECFHYKVETSDLKELNFDIIETIYVNHPLSRIIQKHEVSNQTLTDVVAGLCREGGVGYSIRADIADTLRVSQKLHNRSIYKCLSMAASTAGWNVQIDNGRYATDSIGDTRLPFDLLFETYVNREFINIMDRLQKPINSHTDALDYLVRMSIKDLNRTGLVVIVKKPDEDKK